MLNMRNTKFIAAFCLFLAAGAGYALAQVSGSSVAGADLLRAGEGALAKGEFSAAAGKFGRALRSNDLSDAQVARALYQRGVAYEKSERPAQAIADITGALFLAGLSGEDRAQAYLSRGRAYEAVGMSDLARKDISRAKSGGISASRIARSKQTGSASRQSGGPAFSTTVRSADQHGPAPSFRTQVKPAAPSSARQTRVASFETQTRAPAPPEPEIPRFRTTIVPNNAQAPASWSTATQQGAETAPAAAQEESSGKVSSFLGGLWEKTKSKVGGGGETQSSAPAPPEAPPQAAPQWSQTTSTAASQRTPPPASSAVQPIAASGASGYRIQLAALRSESEAQATWKRLVSRHKNLLGDRQSNIVRTELGGLGTFYRVQLGPFASKTESQQLCKSFKQGGLDCFLLAPYLPALCYLHGHCPIGRKAKIC